MDIDSFVNAVVPWIIGIAGIYLLYRPLKEPLSGLFTWIGNLVRSASGRVKGKTEELVDSGVPQIDYE